MLRGTLFATAVLLTLPMAGASARHQVLAEMSNASSAIRPWIRDEIRLLPVAPPQRRRPRFSFTPPRD